MKITKTQTGYHFEAVTDAEQRVLERLAFEFSGDKEQCSSSDDDEDQAPPKEAR